MVQPETYLQRSIKKIVRQRGGYIVKQHGSMIAEPGIPDLLGCYKGIFIAIECKELNNIPSSAQGIHCRQIKSANGFTMIAYNSQDIIEFLDLIDKYTNTTFLDYLHSIKKEWNDGTSY